MRTRLSVGCAQLTSVGICGGVSVGRCMQSSSPNAAVMAVTWRFRIFCCLRLRMAELKLSGMAVELAPPSKPRVAFKPRGLANRKRTQVTAACAVR